MKYIYIMLSLLAIVQICCRNFDFVTFGVITFIAYTINCAFGITYIVGGVDGYYYISEIVPYTYGAIICQLIFINIYVFLEKKNRSVIFKSAIHISGNENEYGKILVPKYHQFWSALLFACYLIFIYDIAFNIGIQSFFSDASKGQIMKSVSYLFSYGIWGSILCFLYAIKFHDKGKMILSFILILITVLIGSRAYLATIVIGLFGIKCSEYSNTFKEKLKIISLGIITATGLILYKYIYKSVRALDFSDMDISISANLTGLADIDEFRTVFSLYDYIVYNEIGISCIDSFARIISIVPLANKFILTDEPIRLSAQLESAIGSTYGLGGNFWGESFAMGGILFLIIMTIVWLLFLRKVSKITPYESDSNVFLIGCGAYLSFYIHRLDWIQVMGCIKSVIAIYCLYYIYKKIVGNKRIVLL